MVGGRSDRYRAQQCLSKRLRVLLLAHRPRITLKSVVQDQKIMLDLA